MILLIEIDLLFGIPKNEFYHVLKDKILNLPWRIYCNSVQMKIDRISGNIIWCNPCARSSANCHFISNIITKLKLLCLRWVIKLFPHLPLLTKSSAMSTELLPMPIKSTRFAVKSFNIEFLYWTLWIILPFYLNYHILDILKKLIMIRSFYLEKYLVQEILLNEEYHDVL